MSELHPAADAPEAAVSPAAAQAERLLAMLDRLAAKALAMAEVVKEGGSRGSADAFAKNSRAVRLTMSHQMISAHVSHFGGAKSPGKIPTFLKLKKASSLKSIS